MHGIRSIERREFRACTEPSAPESAGEADPQHAEAVAHRAREVDRARLLEVLGRARRSRRCEKSPSNDLGEHLVVEDEVVRAFARADALEQRARERAEAGVVFGELRAEQQVLEPPSARGSPRTSRAACRRQRALAAENARAEHQRRTRSRRSWRPSPSRAAARTDSLGAPSRRCRRRAASAAAVAGLLVAAVAAVRLVHDDFGSRALAASATVSSGARVVDEHDVDRRVVPRQPQRNLRIRPVSSTSILSRCGSASIVTAWPGRMTRARMAPAA